MGLQRFKWIKLHQISFYDFITPKIAILDEILNLLVVDFFPILSSRVYHVPKTLADPVSWLNIALIVIIVP